MSGILAAREVWLLATGREKAGILEAMLRGPIGPDVPASFLRGHPGLRILVDERAATGIAGRT
jgi:glucosamine-6-phosphate deaminase